MTLLGGFTYLDIAHAGIVEQGLEVLFVLVGHLYYHAGIFGKEHAYQVVGLELVEVDVDTALGVGKGHFEQGGDKATCRDVVTGHYPALLNELLHGVECLAEIVGVFNRGHIAAHIALALCKG